MLACPYSKDPRLSHWPACSPVHPVATATIARITTSVGLRISSRLRLWGSVHARASTEVQPPFADEAVQVAVGGYDPGGGWGSAPASQSRQVISSMDEHRT